MRVFVSLILLGLAVLNSVCAVDELKFTKPASLAKEYKKGMYHQPARFGVPTYGVSITGRIIYATPNDRDACQPLDLNSLEKDARPKEGEDFIIMVDRGECTFVTKVRHAQNVGAKAVIIIDNKDEEYIPEMADDGTGTSISIPSMLIRKKDGAEIKNAALESSIIATMRWGLPNPDGVVEWSFWTSSFDDNSVEFKKAFEIVSAALDDNASFEPHYFFLDGTMYDCDKSGGTACGNQCTNSGKYCAVDPEHDLNSGISGADVVRENLRQICIWREVNSTGHPGTWWKYINCFQDTCVGKTDYSEDCSQACMDKLQIKVDLIARCITSSGDYSDKGGVNNLIQNELTLRKEKGVFLLPTVMLNNAPYKGSLKCPVPVQENKCGVLSAICSSFAPGTAPKACNNSDGCPIGQARDPCGACGGDGSVDACGSCLPKDHPDRRNDASQCGSLPSRGMSAAGVVGIVFSIVAVVSLVFFYLHRRSQAHMRKELADIMAQYVPLGNEDKEDFQNLPSAVEAFDTRDRDSSF
jgi:hypothetical protein